MVGESTYEIWLAPLELKLLGTAQLLVDAPAATQTGSPSASAQSSRAARGSPSGLRSRSSSPATARTSRTVRQAQAESVDLAATALNPRYSFEQFIIGDGNRLAHAAALAVAELPGQAYNPLFLHAPRASARPTCCTRSATTCWRSAVAPSSATRPSRRSRTTSSRRSGSRSLDRFKHAYRDADVLLIDDVQFLASKAKTEEEFFHTFNALYETGRQLVLTCDRLPRQLVAVEERLRERFEAGLVADISPRTSPPASRSSASAPRSTAFR